MSKVISKIVVPDSSEQTGYALYNVKDANAIPASEKGAASGVATLDNTGKIPSSQIPSGIVSQQSDWNQTDSTAGDYIKNKPTIPSVGNAKIEIQKNGTKVGSFTTNQSGSKVTMNITVPTGTAANKDVPTSGNASTSQIVMGNDSRLTDSRNAKDVYSWAKASSKPTYTASEVGAIPTSAKGAASGVASLDSSGKVPSSQLPSYVDDVLEYDTKSAFPTTGEAGKIYVDKATNLTWRWGGSAYTQIKGDLVIGTTSGTAADGGTASAHYSNTSNPHSVTKSQVGLGRVVNTGDSATPVSGGTTKFTTGGAYTELAKKVDKESGKGLSTNDYTTDEKNKLSGIASGAEVNQNAFSNVVVGTTTISADGKTDSITLVAGSNVTLTPDATNDKITIAATDTTYSAATTSAAGLMSADDKTKLNGIATGATKVTTDTVSGWGYTKNAGTVTSVKMNGTTKNPSSGVVDLGTVITSHQDISGKVNTTTTVNGHALSSNVTVTKSDVGLGSVGNFKAVSTAASQGLSNTEKSNARANIGAGTSSFSGSYNDLSNKPTIPTNNNQLTNGAGYITGITKSMVTTALGYTPPTSDTNTWRTVQCNGTSIGNNTLNLKAGTNVSLSNSNGTITITSTDTNTWPSKVSQLTNDSGFLTAASFTNNNKGTSVGKIMVADASNGLGYSTPSDLKSVLGINGKAEVSYDSTQAFVGDGTHFYIAIIRATKKLRIGCYDSSGTWFSRDL